MKLIATRGDIEAYAEMPFNPETDDVIVVPPEGKPVTLLWQSALKWGYWDEA